MSNEQTIWRFLKGKGLNDYAVAGIMGNLYAESGLSPKNLQNTYEKSLGMSDDAYTAAVDNGTYKNFVKNSAGYGLAQWTYWSRKQNLLDFAKAQGKSIGDLDMQLDFLWKEMSAYTGMMATLRSASSVREASNAVLLEYERPASKDTIETQNRRAGFGQTYYDKFATQGQAASQTGGMTLDEFRKLHQEMRRNLQDNDSSAYSKEAREWATSTGLITGGGKMPNGEPNYMWEDILTREQFVTVLYRLTKMIGLE